ncbi:MAG: 50S ribosomal protein L21 [Vampirovibrio sp.]|jgi:large subunit ribosomal protein L21|nr:50S ribosomal protein L21 [Vampirovibrio sp.]
MYAIVEISGKQYKVEQGRYLDVDTFNASVDEAVSFDKVQLVVGEEGSVVGLPYVEGAVVTGKVLAHGREKKILVYKMRPKKGYRKKNGHRQGYTRILIESIVGLGSKAEAKPAKAKKAAKA